MARLSLLQWTRNAASSGSRPGFRRGAILALVVVAGAWILISSLATYVRPSEAAIRESRYGGGIDKTPVYGPRWFLTGPGVTYHRFPIVVQALDMVKDPKESSAG